MQRKLILSFGVVVTFSVCCIWQSVRHTIYDHTSGGHAPFLNLGSRNENVTMADVPLLGNKDYLKLYSNPPTSTLSYSTRTSTLPTLQTNITNPTTSPTRHERLATMDANSSVNILLLSYQRSGSSIISSLFGYDPNIFFIFEPLDALYVAMYGTAPGWNVPSDITFKKDGSLRNIPPAEKKHVATFLDSMYSCNFNDVPVEFLVHPFWWYFKNWTVMAKPYVSCLTTTGVKMSLLGAAQRRLRLTCGQRFGDLRTRQGKCFEKIWPNSSHVSTTDGNFFKSLFKSSSNKDIQLYSANMEKIRNKVKYCVKRYLTEPCQRSKIKVLKTVRATMEEVSLLLETNPHLKVIHLVRDPHGVTRSRSKATWSQGMYERRDLGRIAQVYCDTALADHNAHVQLNKTYPNRVLFLQLEDFINFPKIKLKEVYTFLGLSVKSDTFELFNKKIKHGFADKWKTDLSTLAISKIDAMCSQFLKVLSGKS